ncbi:MAG TPA: hypothetical protein PK175_01285 [Syntrophales bacterium]|jgi:hypothetical protein|nr:hypothetical protein [Syntrophales bacterium]HON22626.1 hypothetical protein [Syntrophales bacterium]HOU77480.1 hypothetical protein [Syntrophales bacterium]HPC31818.1 hypothetical protein [Syntrophales bacterium]HQG33491.1 hypothetical protein [Syntrophales bacterium]
MGSVLKNVAGMISYEMPSAGLVVVVFDDQRTSPAKIVRAMENGRFTVQGKPVYVPLRTSTAPRP